jgi:murein DD-endopeptidase MepM/ murein hydrolase activator NlpD
VPSLRFAALAVVVGAAALAPGVGVSTARIDLDREAAGSDAPSATCTAAQKAKAQRALRAFKRTMAAKRRAYFRSHPSAPARKAWVKRQKAKLRKLQRAAACQIRQAMPPAPLPPEPRPYTFFPQAGILGQDLFINNFVDLDSSGAVRDWSCGSHSYDGHGGIDSDIASFRTQAIGVPVFAALDGRVTRVRDGEADTNTAAAPLADNHVILDHGDSHHTIYGHLKQGSVPVSVGQRVAAGTQIGLTGSSGSSTWPHLHFESRFRGAPYEPFAGACRPGASNWVRQPPLRTDVYARDFTFSRNPFEGRAALPWDEALRTGTFAAGQRLLYFRVQLANLPANSTRRIRFARPDGSVADDSSDGFDNGQPIRSGWWWFARSLDLAATGDWRMLLEVNGNTVVDAPFTVVAAAIEVVNRPPRPITVQFETPPSATDVPVCQVATSLVVEDPDYDIVRYRYRWTLNGALAREVVSAALSDALPKGTAPGGAVLTCSVLPSDGQLSGPDAATTATVGS